MWQRPHLIHFIMAPDGPHDNKRFYNILLHGSYIAKLKTAPRSQRLAHPCGGSCPPAEGSPFDRFSYVFNTGCPSWQSDIDANDELYVEFKFLQDFIPKENMGPVEILKFLRWRACFPNATIAYRVLLTIPVASTERSFSKLKATDVMLAFCNDTGKV